MSFSPAIVPLAALPKIAIVVRENSEDKNHTITHLLLWNATDTSQVGADYYLIIAFPTSVKTPVELFYTLLRMVSVKKICGEHTKIL